MDSAAQSVSRRASRHIGTKTGTTLLAALMVTAIIATGKGSDLDAAMRRSQIAITAPAPAPQGRD